ncbi:MAG: hypothetical protein V5A44_00125 [Haloarculaceae archaeon]
MSLAITHFAVGVACTAVILTLFVPAVPFQRTLVVTALGDYRDYRTPEPVREAMPESVFPADED